MAAGRISVITQNLLLVEDNPQNRYLATFLLERSGYRVTALFDGHNVVPAACALLPAGILIDIQLPGLDGYDVARALRHEPRLSGIPIIAITSYAMEGDREKALAAGCDGYIEKPIDPDTFVAAIEAILTRRAAAVS